MSDSENFAQPEEQLGEALDAELEEVFAETDPDVDGDGEVTSLEAQLAERIEDLQTDRAARETPTRLAQRTPLLFPALLLNLRQRQPLRPEAPPPHPAHRQDGRFAGT